MTQNEPENKTRWLPVILAAAAKYLFLPEIFVEGNIAYQVVRTIFSSMKAKRGNSQKLSGAARFALFIGVSVLTVLAHKGTTRFLKSTPTD